jgi:Family of unknown function (DUF6504)
MRMYADPVEVRPVPGDGTGAPAAFLWRGRLYVVRDVLGHWRERRAWWSTPAARLVHGEGEGPVGVARAGREADPGAGQGGDQVARASRVADLAEEREVWRVAASPGRAYRGGVYDLSREPAGAASPSRGSPADEWRLVRIED